MQDFMQEYRFLLTKALIDQGATQVAVERERYIGSGRAVFAVSAAHWPTKSDRNPGTIRQYVVEPAPGGLARMAEIGNGQPVSLADYDVLAS